MALPQPIIHCLIDQEPTSFHQADLDETMISFAVNLSFEYTADVADEDKAKNKFGQFLQCLQLVRFRVFSLTQANPTLTPAGPVNETISAKPYADPKELFAWLEELAPSNNGTNQYWSTAPATAAETTIDADVATATHRLRAVQSWNAPVGHKFALTHIVRIARATIEQAGKRFVVLPYFSDPADTDVPTFVMSLPPQDTHPPDNEIALDFSYDPLGNFDNAICRTNWIGDGITKIPFQPSDVDNSLTENGYFKVDGDAENVRRLLTWFEERAASLMTANSGLPRPGNAKNEIEAFEQLFGIRAFTKLEQDGKIKFVWSSKAPPWYAATRLISALDNLVIALLKPAAVSPGARDSEGQVLAPFMTPLIGRIKKEADAAGLAVNSDLLDSSRLTRAVRNALRKSPLMSGLIDPSRLVRALRHIYGLPSPPNVLDEPALITALLEGFQNPEVPPQHAAYLDSLEGKSALVIDRKLAELEQVLHEEAGAEAAIVRLIETVEITANGSAPAPAERFSALIADFATKDVPPDLRDRWKAVVERAADAAWIDYRALLDSPFNGAEAIRRAAGSTFVLELLSYAESHPSNKKKKERTTSEYLCQLLRASSFYEARFFDKPKKLPGLTAALLKPDTASLPNSVHFAVRLQLRRAFHAAIEPLKSLNDPNARFIPDSTPQPIPIQIAANIGGSTVEEFAKSLNGIAIAIQRADKSAAPDEWAHAHLADLGWTMPSVGHDDPVDVAAAIHPMLPAASDGRSPMFIEYQGFPFSDRALDARILDNDAEPRNDKRRPFYRHDPHVAADDFAKVPRLAYGRAFKTFSFVTSNAGTLPLALQSDWASPWMPKAAPPPPGPDAPPPPEPPPSPLLVGTAPYQRRTAIAQMAVIETPVRDRAPRIGAEIAGVTPLARDYPRVALLAEPNGSAVRDILREADGSGKMVAKQNSEWRLSDIEFDGVPETLTLRFFDRPAKDPSDSGDATFVINEDTVAGFTAISEIAVSIEFRPKKSGTIERWLHIRCGGTTLDPKQIPDGNDVAGWLRLVLDTFSHGRAMVSFANIGSQKSDNVTDPLLLLAPNDIGSTVWKQGLSDTVEVTVSTPRVGYLDFDRWFANVDLREDMFFWKEEDDDDVKGSIRQFEQALIAAYVMRHLDPGLAASLDRLPDPAVDQARIELTPHDALTAHNPQLDIAYQTLPLKEKLREFGRGFSARVKKMIEDEGISKPEEKARPWSPRRLRKYVFDPLDKQFQFKIALTPGPSLNLKKPGDDAPIFSATVPAGAVARLSIEALVPSQHFEQQNTHPSVFHPGLMQYAQRKLQGDYLAFPAAALRIETMYEGMSELAAKDPEKEDRNQPAIDLAAAMIGAEGIERTRRFDLMTSALPPGADATRHWRLLAEIDVTTQRWRNTGRPIYHFVNPRQYRFDEKPEEAAVPHPALRLRFGADGKDELAQFELEAFFDRSDIDAQTITKTLEPLPARTKLQEHYWNPESASYFRHRFRLRSRYAGALRERSRGEAIAWPTRERTKKLAVELKTPAHAWTMRVAMLADLSHIQLTRPQLRALIPLTTTPGDDDGRTPAPPVAAILQEPPFARGGLADRIASEVKTGFSYGFKTDVLEILDSRKEAGPDPRLDYRPLNGDIALGLTLRSEGPMGLTFDNIDAPAPAYPNSMFSLKPATLYGKEVPIEELFVGAAMRRYIDPNWTTEASKPVENLDGERCWWIIPGKGNNLPTELTCAVPGSGQTFPILTLKQSSTSIEVQASRLAVDGIPPASGEDPVTILKVDRAKVLSLAILHQPVAPGRYSASIFATTNSAGTERGESDTPLMLASFEWSPAVKDADGKSADKLPPVNLNAPGMSACPTAASAPTFLRWTKTGRDFDVLHLPKFNKETDSWSLDRRHVRSLVAALDPTHHELTFELGGAAKTTVWLGPSIFCSPYPLHVHRHLGIITSYFLKELGRPAELFCRTAVARANKAVLVGPNGTAVDLKKDPRDQIARVVEFEAPAQILCDKNLPASNKYKQAYFDLLSTGFKDGEPANTHLYFRIVGPPSHQRAFTELKITLGAANHAEKTIPLKWLNKPELFTVGVHLILRQPGAGEASVEAHALLSDGTLNKIILADAHKTAPLLKTPGVFVSVEAPALGREFWTDVSLLHSSGKDKPATLDFDWLFSSGNDQEPAVSVSPAGLNTMTEAQARVIAVSPPIPIVRH